MDNAQNARQGIIYQIAVYLGTSDCAIRLLLSLLLGYPLALCHRWMLRGKNPVFQHLFFTACGISLLYFNFGWDVCHSLANILMIYIVLLACGGTKLSVLLAFIINMSYLTIAYIVTGTDGYDIKWSTPHCVLCLRLIGLTFDIYDGQKKSDNLSEDQKTSAIARCPSLIEIFGFTYFFGGFMVGPQFSIRQYLDLVSGVYEDAINNVGAMSLPQCILEGVQRSLFGLGYLVMFQLLSMYIPTEFLLSDEYSILPLWQKLLYAGLWCKVYLYKYLSVFILSEASCIMTGLSYNGKDKNGNNLWDGCCNIYLKKYESATKFSDKIQSFNVNTNRWMAKYIFKRLRFLGNKNISQCTTLFYLAWWHGIFSGYFMNFSLEFFIMKFEKDVSTFIENNTFLCSIVNHPLVLPVKWMFCKLWLYIFLGYPLSAFVMLTYSRWLKFYSSIYFIGHVIFCGWFVLATGVDVIRNCGKQSPIHDKKDS